MLFRSGTVSYIVFLEDNTSNFPDIIIVHFESYLGPSCLGNEEKMVAIIPRTATWMFKNQMFSRKQFPLQPAYGLSIHKGIIKPVIAIMYGFNKQ